MKKQFLFFLRSLSLISIFLLISCSNSELSKENALELVKQKDIAENCFFVFTTNTKSGWETYKSDLKTFGELIDLNLMKAGKTYRRRASVMLPYFTTHEYLPTSKAIKEYGFKKTNSGFGGSKAYVMYSKAVVKQIIGISYAEDSKTATVLVRIDYEKTPFAKLQGNRYEPSYCNTKNTIEKEIEFVNYDTGWRIKKR